MKNLKLISALLSLCLFVQISYAQPIGGFDAMHKKIMSEDAAYRARILANETQMRDYIRKHKADALRPSRMSSVLYTIPVVVQECG